MKKQDIIRIINEEVEIALNEMYDPIYNSNLPEIVASLITSGVTIKQIIKFILEKYKNKKNGDKLDKDTIVEIIKKAKSKLNESINENEGMKKSLKDIDPSLSLTTYGTKPPSFKITYRVKDDMSKEMEQELVAWVLSKGGVVESVANNFYVEDGERYYYPYVKFSYK
jgi:hypothetical protein